MTLPGLHRQELDGRAGQQFAYDRLFVDAAIAVGFGPAAGPEAGGLAQVLARVPDVVVRMGVQDSGELGGEVLVDPALGDACPVRLNEFQALAIGSRVRYHTAGDADGRPDPDR